ncbi:DUF2505 domain-containing protein [Propionibacterium freudenreichii]|uniref:DUF2505 domain-containing protein n=1 Tax=Propionibacterium freudenreichii TaxID=1744 RepID=UPI000542FE8B|nr:DUF2505 domain-containing protein [Propionibacterium freudenreichii]MDK9345861.1 DUF2505 domain-containing protein [Propionibacterium freudenreichii]CEH06525.1 Hypothetical protein PFCIRM135_04650 [Propionibacterium freudenreichii]SBM43437.1 Hypothetical protein PFR_JS2_1278 [Propionibacterium freudenreichii]
MEFTAEHHYDAEPAAVYAMFNDPQWWRTLVERAGAESSRITAQDATVDVHIELTTPQKARPFAGDTLGLDQTFIWTPTDGGWDGTFRQGTAGKLPAASAGTATIRAGHGGTDVHYTGEFTVKIPVMGRKLEAMAAPYVTQIIDLQQKVGTEWLSAHKG